ncbi:hypothetical protein HAZT_HAZT005310 [Hyalella azteca]|uniref:Uncharacterized protein n=1 Tax=Hyalella azteca TaxID=294128 RepID=A0A6A0GNK4_HYAAZ|nr:hypothetical protein HAZT_HAZT005310 [Hyalella azteca]
MVLQNESCREGGPLLEYDESPLEIPLDLSVSTRSQISVSPSSYDQLDESSEFVKHKSFYDDDEDEIKSHGLNERNSSRKAFHRHGIRVRPEQDILKKEYFPEDIDAPELNQRLRSDSNLMRSPLRSTFSCRTDRERLQYSELEKLQYSSEYPEEGIEDFIKSPRSPMTYPLGGGRSCGPSMYTPPHLEHLSLKGEPPHLSFKGDLSQFARRIPNPTPLRGEVALEEEELPKSKLFLAVTGVTDSHYLNGSSLRSAPYWDRRSPSIPKDRMHCRSQSPFREQAPQTGASSPCGAQDYPYRRYPSPASFSSDLGRPQTPESPPGMDTSEADEVVFRPPILSAAARKYYSDLRATTPPELPNSDTHISSSPDNNISSSSNVVSSSCTSSTKLLPEEIEAEYNKRIGCSSSSSSPDGFLDATVSQDSEERAKLRRDYKKDLLKRFRAHPGVVPMSGQCRFGCDELRAARIRIPVQASSLPCMCGVLCMLCVCVMCWDVCCVCVLFVEVCVGVRVMCYLVCVVCV